MQKAILVHFGEIWLKGRNRVFYINKLISSITEKLNGLDFSIERRFDRIVIYTNELEKAKERLAHVFGISHFEEVEELPTKKEEITRYLINKFKEENIKSVRIEAHRSDKTISFNSIELLNFIKKEAKKINVKLDFKNFEKRIWINMTKDITYIYSNKIKGLGGMPEKTSGKAIILLSGGIDSPVSAFLAMKRGIEPIYLHIHPFNDNKIALENEKIKEMFSLLDSYVSSIKYFIPSYIFQAEAIKAGQYEVIMFKRFLLKVAEKIAKKEGALAIYTGDSLAQVSSQTLQNIYTEGYNIKIPIFRPLIGLDKEEIVSLAKKINTFDISAKPYPDVCSIFARHPKTKSNIEEILALEKSMNFSTIIKESLKRALRVDSSITS